MDITNRRAKFLTFGVELLHVTLPKVFRIACLYCLHFHITIRRDSLRQGSQSYKYRLRVTTIVTKRKTILGETDL